MNECDQDHPQCHPPAIIPLKLINCETRCLERLPTHEPYCALSYVWGNVGPHDEDYHVDVTLPLSLPATIEDAIASTLNLHLKYLWVDRYCISQHQHNERVQEIGRMDEIYQGAYIVLIDAEGQNPNHGLAGVNLVRNSHARLRVGKQELVEVLIHPDRHIADSKWGSRGWTYQESVMARRRLFFTKEQFYFECQVYTFTEAVCFPTPTEKWRNGHLIRRLDCVPGLQPAICQHIHEYTKRRLTYSSDSLKAILGILHHLEVSSSPDHHYWGVPILLCDVPTGTIENRAGFLLGLCWRTAGTSPPKTRRHAFPSWSWSGWDNAPHGVTWSEHSPFSISTSPDLMPSLEIMHDGSLLNWETLGTMLLDGGARAGSQDSSKPGTTQEFYSTSTLSHLHMRGLVTVFDATIHPNHKNHCHDIKTVSFRYIAPRADPNKKLKQTARAYFDDNIPESLESCTAILLGYQFNNSLKSINYLLLKPVEAASSSDAHNKSEVYERIGLLQLEWREVSLTFSDFDWFERGDDFPAFRDSDWFLQAEWRDVIIG